MQLYIVQELNATVKEQFALPQICVRESSKINVLASRCVHGLS
jgi:hypothetical protein